MEGKWPCRWSRIASPNTRVRSVMYATTTDFSSICRWFYGCRGKAILVGFFSFGLHFPRLNERRTWRDNWVESSINSKYWYLRKWLPQRFKFSTLPPSNTFPVMNATSLSLFFSNACDKRITIPAVRWSSQFNTERFTTSPCFTMLCSNANSWLLSKSKSPIRS